MTDSLIETENIFSKTILQWYAGQKRDLPWRENSTPYHVWLSEIILQQTRIAQGLPYYLAFTEKYPSVHDLASAPEDEVLRLWQGLGYYSRARNLHATSKIISSEYGGKFPDSYKELVKLKGVGPYTAAAIASICFGEPVPVIDGNVYRLASRVFGIHDDISLGGTRKVFEEKLKEVISNNFPGDFNQGMMEMGSLVCTPTNPKCPECPLKELCYAFQHKKQAVLPVKTKKTKVKNRTFHYHVWEHDNHLAMKKRESGDVWQGLYDFDLQENKNSVEENPGTYHTSSSNGYTHILSHQKITAFFHHHRIEDPSFFRYILEKNNLSPFSADEIVTLPKPKLIVNYLKDLDF